jgi:hypothetical protein
MVPRRIWENPRKEVLVMIATEMEMKLVELESSYLEFVSGGKPKESSTTTITCGAGESPHTTSGTNSNGQTFITVKCW